MNRNNFLIEGHSNCMHKLDELQEEHERLDLSRFEEGDMIEVTYRKFIHEGDLVFTDIENEQRTETFRVVKKTHPSNPSPVETILWETHSPRGDRDLSVSDTRTISKGPQIHGFIDTIEQKH